MADRRVKKSAKDEDEDIIGLCWEGADGLKYTSRADAISDITNGTHRYYVEEEAPAVDVLARPEGKPTYLTTEADGTSKNNLDNLPDCKKAE